MSAIVEQVAPSPSFPDFGAEIQSLLDQFTAGAAQVLSSVDRTVVQVSQIAFITVLLIGLLIYFTHVNRRMGRELIIGGIILGVLSEWVFPRLAGL